MNKFFQAAAIIPASFWSSLLRAQENQQDEFWSKLLALCGKAYSGQIAMASADDSTFHGKTIVIHARICAGDNVLIHLHIGENRSITWIISKSAELITFRHDHRNEDGSESYFSWYGGTTTNRGTAWTQFFPADQGTLDKSVEAAGKVWWLEFRPDDLLIYHQDDLVSSRRTSLVFDISSPVDPPPMPWGWE